MLNDDVQDAQKPWMRPCAICKEICSHQGARGNNVVCRNCESRAVDSLGRPVSFRDVVRRTGDTHEFLGPGAFYRDPDPEAGERNLEVSSTFTCWVDGVECNLYEGVAGWVGLVRPVSELIQN